MKKGAIELTLNTIVIIIFAVTFLGLGLFFIKEYMGKIPPFNFPEPDVGATSDSPIVLGFSTMEIQRNAQAQFKVGFYNSKNESVMVKPQISVCVPEGLGNTTTSLEQAVDVGKAAVFDAVFRIPKNAPSQTYICDLVIGDISKQFTVKVQ
jgi:hypothetical protein